MSLSNRLRDNNQKRSINNQYIDPIVPGRALYAADSGVVINSESAIRISTVYACVRLLADTVSSLPVSAYVRRGRARLPYAVVYGEQPAWVTKPNPETTRLEFYEQIVTSFKLEGNAYILTIRDEMGEVQELYVLNPRNVRIVRPAPGEPFIYYVQIKDSNGTYEQMLTARELLHIPDFRLPGEFYGLSPVAACRTTMGSVMAAEVYAASYFGNAANPGGVITHTGPYRAGKIGILSGGASFQTLQINAQDAQLLETRKFSVEEIGRIYRVPLSLLGHPVAGAMSFASVEAQNLSFVQHSLRPILERIEQSLSTLLPESDGFIRFNLDALLRGTTIERYDAYTKGLREGFLSLNDVHASEDMSPIENGDQYRVPLQNIDATDAKDVGLKLRAEIAASLIQVGFDPAAVAKAVGLPEMQHTGLPSSQLQPVAQIDPADPEAVYEVK